MNGSATNATRHATPLPPGQRAVGGFPRFGTHLHRPPPPVPEDPGITISGAVTEPAFVPLTELASLPRRAVVADFHCVSGWSAVGLHWEGVTFETFYRHRVAPLVPPGSTVTHVVFGGLDGFESRVCIEDALDEDVLIADRLNGRPLDADHGAPARLVSPKQYGYISTKHLCVIEILTAASSRELGSAHPISRVALRGPLIKRHPRARVQHEERHPTIPARWLRPVYRLFIGPGMRICGRGTRLKG